MPPPVGLLKLLALRAALALYRIYRVFLFVSGYDGPETVLLHLVTKTVGLSPELTNRVWTSSVQRLWVVQNLHAIDMVHRVLTVKEYRCVLIRIRCNRVVCLKHTGRSILYIGKVMPKF